MVIFTMFCTVGAVKAQMMDDQAWSNHSIEVKEVKGPSRAPASYVPNDEVAVAPEKQKIWLQKVIVEDDAGIANEMRRTFEKWDRDEQYARQWNMASSGLFEIKGQKERKEYFDRMILKYIDKRISGEVKSAEKGSAFHKVGQVQKALKPKAEVAISSKVKLKFKAKVLEQKAILELRNPYVEYKTHVNATGEIKMEIRKDIKFADVKANVDYYVDRGQYVAYIDKKITKQVTGRVSSSQSDKEVVFGSSSSKQVQLFFNHSF
jgi:hypothetical protein